jgi:hypothetical protein
MFPRPALVQVNVAALDVIDRAAGDAFTAARAARFRLLALAPGCPAAI